MNVLDIQVSKFDSVMNTDSPIQVDLYEWLNDTSQKDRIQELRNLKGKAYKEAKKKLPGITPSGTFHTRKEDGLIQHSGLIQFDVDGKDNPVNMDDLKRKIQLIPYVAYLSYSTSGNGLWGLIPIQYPSEHKGQFRAIARAFNKAEVTIDRAPSNVASFRFCSYDPEPYFNENAEVFPYLIDETKPQRTGRDNRQKVEGLISKIQANRVDITDGYDNWIKIGFALSEEFGESGRIYFHQVSQWHPGYNTSECDQQFERCLNSNGRGISIASFFHLCKEYGIMIKRDKALRSGGIDNGLESNFESQHSAPFGMNPYTGEIFDERGYPSEWDFHLN